MKARIIHTNFYSSERVLELSKNARWLFMYYLTCSGISLTGAFKWSDSKTIFETALTKVELEKSKAELIHTKLVFFLENWVVVPNTQEKTGYGISPVTQVPYTKELSSLPEEIKKILEGIERVGIPSAEGGIPIEIRNQKSEIKGIVKGNYSSLKDLSQKEFEEIAQEYSISVTTVTKKYSDLVNYCQSKGKKYKNYLATLKAWISKDLESGKLHKEVKSPVLVVPEIDAAERAKVSSLIAEARGKIGRSHER